MGEQKLFVRPEISKWEEKDDQLTKGKVNITDDPAWFNKDHQNTLEDETPLPTVTVIMPVRNESDFIRESLSAVIQQDYPADRMEILVVDGISTDDTRSVVQEIQAQYPYVRLVDNPGKIVPIGLNIALAQAKGEIIVRVDGHCIIRQDYVRHCVDHLVHEDVDAVGGPMETIGQSSTAQAIAVAMSSPFGVGGSAFRTIRDRKMFVDTVAFPAYRRETVREVGPFDEELVRNQDDEYNYRLRAMGGRILMTPEVRSRYYSRGTFSTLWRQYFQYGYWKVRVMQKHPHQMSLRQFVPPLFVATLVLLSLLGLFFGPARLLLMASIGAYLTANLAASLFTASKQNWRFLLQLPLAFAILHISYGSGFLYGLIRFAGLWKTEMNSIPVTGKLKKKTRPLRVLMITSEWPTPERPHEVPFITQQAAYLRQAGVDLQVFPFRGGKRFGRYAAAWRKAREEIASGSYDLVHAQWGQSGLLALPRQIPLVVTFRGDDLEGIIGKNGRHTRQGLILKNASRLVARSADQVILVSKSLSRSLSRQDFHIIPSGLDLQLFHPAPQDEARRKLGLDPDRHYVLFAGNSSNPRKRYCLARQAVSLLPPERNAELLLADKIPHDQIPDYMNASNVLLLTSLHEGSPNVVKEALACNLPVVSTDVGDVRERIEKIDGCFILENDTPEAIARVLEIVLRRSERTNSRPAVEELDENHLAQKVIQVYQQAINHHNR